MTIAFYQFMLEHQLIGRREKFLSETHYFTEVLYESDLSELGVKLFRSGGIDRWMASMDRTAKEISAAGLNRALNKLMALSRDNA